jgi:hypothetical protein
LETLFTIIKFITAVHSNPSKKRPSLIILLSYFGKKPWYFYYFLNSCRCNPSIAFSLATDLDLQGEDIPKNLALRKITLHQFNRIASKKLGFSTTIKTGYKVCDFKPALGYLFPELIEGYDFWGSGDIDLVYGNIRYFLTNEILSAYDVFSFRPEYLSGCLTLYRNNQKMNQLFMESEHYQKVLSEAKYFNFDECNFIFNPLHLGEEIDQIPCEIESMTHIVKRKAAIGELKAHFDFNLLEGLIGKIRWHKGRIIYKNQFEAILYHFLEFKKVCKRKDPVRLLNENEILFFSRQNIYKRKAYAL